MEMVVNPKLNRSELITFFDSAGWDKENIENLRKGLKKSHVIAAFEEGKLVGLVRAISDYATTAYIQDLLVLPEYEDSQLGADLIRHSVRYFDSLNHIAVLSARADDKTDRFFRYLGFDKEQDIGYGAYILR